MEAAAYFVGAGALTNTARHSGAGRAEIQITRTATGLRVMIRDDGKGGARYVEETYASELLANGAAGVGYLLKDRAGRVEEFLAALDRVAAGGTALDPEVVTELLTGHRATPLDSLTVREREVLQLMAEGQDNATIAATLVITERAVSKHIGNVFLKLGLPPADAGHRRVLAVLAYLESR